MRQRTRETLLGAASVALYVGGVVAFLVVAGRAWVAVDAHAAGEITTLDFVLAGVGIALFAAARRVGPKLERWWSLDASEGIGGRRPEPSELEQLGYRVPRDAPDDTERTTTYEDGTLYRVCPECGERNETEFDYCWNCSSELQQ